MEKVFVIAIFTIVVVSLLVAYERPVKGKNKITGRGGDFE